MFMVMLLDFFLSFWRAIYINIFPFLLYVFISKPISKIEYIIGSI
jgi:hypothetical protein